MAKLRPLKAIRAKCMDCTNNQFIEIKNCPITKCPLHEYRMGHRPKDDKSIADNGTDEKV